MNAWLRSLLKPPKPPTKAQITFISVQGILITVTHKHVRRLRLSIRAPEGQVRISAPWFTPLSAVESFALSHIDWIRRQSEKLTETNPPLPRDKSKEARQRQELRSAVAALLQHWEPIIGDRAQSFGIKRMKTRWGSCNVVAKRIWINLALAEKPPRCLEYVVVHELVHLLEPSHNARFKALMTQFLPDWKSRQKELSSR